MSQVLAARAVARAFFGSYVAYLYGRLPAGRVVGVDQALRSQLEHGHTTITPAEQSSRPQITRLSAVSAGPPISVIAIAVIAVNGDQASELTATLEPHGRAWLVVAVSG